MLYNTGHKFSKFISPPSQEEIFNCPEYFAMSCEEVLSHGQCPEFLKRLIMQYPWQGRPSVLQIRPQDFRQGIPPLLGAEWHCDMNVRLKDGKERVAINLEDWHLMVCSWGDVTETEFIKSPLELPELTVNPPYHGHAEFWAHLKTIPFEIEACRPGQLGEYTSKDIHRMRPAVRNNRFRLMIVAFESSNVRGDGWVLPSMKAKQDPNLPYPKFHEYIT